MTYSEYAAFLCDANKKEPTVKGDKRGNAYLTVYTEIYRSLRDAGFNVSITDAEHLEENLFNIRVLYVPCVDMLSPEEKRAVEKARAKGMRVFENSFTGSDTNCIAFKEYGVNPLTRAERVFSPYYSVYDIEELTGIYPDAEPLSPHLGIQMLEGDGYNLIVLTNHSAVKKEFSAKLRIHIPFRTAEFYDINGEKCVSIQGNELTVPHMTDGGIIILR